MNHSLKSICTERLEKIVGKHCTDRPDPVIVLAGTEPYIDMERFSGKIADPGTFGTEGDFTVSDKGWFSRTMQGLSEAGEYRILSHRQFASLGGYMQDNPLAGRAVIVYDNLRTLYMIGKEDYIEAADARGDEVRPEGLPCYQAEQFKIKDSFYYSLNGFDDSLAKEPLFTSSKGLSRAEGPADPSARILDVISDPYSIDIFVNDCIVSGDFGVKVYVKISGKNILSQATLRTLETVNYLLSLSGGGIFILQEQPVPRDYTPSEEPVRLLRKYWGDGASFRDIQVYENPETGSGIIPVSQGLLVDTIIKEYENCRSGLRPRDVFITAPTGSGKSLIFQLPAFYAASKGDVTIVVSPLKALMTDQVGMLHSERGYDRVEFLNGDLTLVDREKIIECCKNGDIDILYLSPELLLSYDMDYFIGERNLGLFIVDEAHLITTWGRDFRVDYWFLGSHIDRMRKAGRYMFPLVALTATAVYGGINDMVFDSIGSLNMHDPHKFIGNVRRDDIGFVIDTHEDYASGSYDTHKEDETVNFIKGVHAQGIKSIIYAPYTRHINRLKSKCDDIDPEMTVSFHGKMAPDVQKFAYQAFKSNACKIMIATKAFGMGVDIPDIQVVYHHAPSGLLPDYIQEIGRAARKSGLRGFASLTFSKSDLRYSKQLFGASSLKIFQLKEILNKIMRCYISSGRSRNLLVAANDFAYIFDTAEDVDQKVAAALMMIEKDYLIKYRYNVLTARPRRLYTKVYARTVADSLEKLGAKYGKCFREVPLNKGGYHTIELNLDDIWTKHFSDRSFPQVRSEFYRQRFLKEDGIDLTPQIKVTITLGCSPVKAAGMVQKVLDAAAESFAQFRFRGEFFSMKDYVEALSGRLGSRYNAEKIATFILGTYSGCMKGAGTLEGDAFLLQRHYGFSLHYQVFNSNYAAKLARLSGIFSRLFDGKTRHSADRYLSINEMPLKNHIRLGSLLEIMNIGTFKTSGGDEPKVFLRLNDPFRIEKDAQDEGYSNSILDAVQSRHKASCALFEHFFTCSFSDKERWDMIEDFFLGTSVDELLGKYRSETVNHVDILGYLKQNCRAAGDEDVAVETGYADSRQTDIFKPKENQFYGKDNMLSVGQKTMPLKNWLTEDPVTLHKTLTEYNISIDKDAFKILVSKLRVNHFDYYRDFMRLKMLIEFPGYPALVQAMVPYSSAPVKFYKWWKKHPDSITMSYAEKIRLFLAVDKENPKALLKADKALIGK